MFINDITGMLPTTNDGISYSNWQIEDIDKKDCKSSNVQNQTEKSRKLVLKTTEFLINSLPFNRALTASVTFHMLPSLLLPQT